MAEVGALRVSLSLNSADFRSGIQDINRRLRAVDSEFRVAAASSNVFNGSMDGLQARAENLARKLQLQQAKAEELRREYQRLSREQGENAAATIEALTAYNRAEAAMQRTSNRLDNLNQQIQRQSSVWGRLQRSLSSTGERLTTLGGKMQSTGQEIASSFGVATAAVGAGLAVATKKAMDFEAQMSSVKSVMSPTEAKQFGKALEDLAVTMGADTKYSAIEAAQGIEELVKAGVSVTDILNGGLEGALSLATAGELELGDAAEIASTALNAFKSDSLSVGQAANILAGAANASATSVSEMKFGLSAVASVASGVGMNFKDASTALAVFAQNGLKGSDAGTSLKTMLMNLTPASEEAYGTMRDLGIITKDNVNKFYDAKGNLKSLADVTDVLRDALVKLNPQERGKALREMFGSDAIRAGNILFKEGAKGVDAMAKSMDKIKAADVAAEKLNNLKGRMEQLKGAFETGLISLGNSLMPVVNVLVAGLQKLVDKFNGLSPGMQKFIAIGGLVTTVILGIITTIGIVLAAVGGAIAGFGALAEAVGGAAGVAAGFSSVMGVITGPIGITIAVIAALVAAFVALYKNNEEFRNKVLEIWGSIQNAFSISMNFINGIVHSVMTEVMVFIGAVLGQIRIFWNKNGSQIMQAAKNVWSFVSSLIKAQMQYIKGVFQIIWPIITGIIKIAWGVIKNVISTGINVVLGIIKLFAKVFTGDWKGAFNTALDIAKDIWKGITGVFKGINLHQIGKDIIQGLIKGIGSMGSAITSKVKELANLVPKGMKNMLGIHSPSRVMRDQVGKWIPAGVAEGINQNIKVVTKASNKMASIPANQVPKTTNNADMSGFVRIVEKAMNRPVVIEVNGREFIRATANDINEVLTVLGTRNNRMGGVL